MQMRFAALFAATVLVALSAVFAAKPIGSGPSAGTAEATTATYVVVEPDDCPWETSSDA